MSEKLAEIRLQSLPATVAPALNRALRPSSTQVVTKIVVQLFSAVQQLTPPREWLTWSERDSFGIRE